jgi:hypothetical protein
MQAPSLTEREIQVIGECLACVAAADVIEDDWEFSTLFGMSFTQFCAISDSWPLVRLEDELVICATHNALIHLVGYPHGHNDIWGTRISATRQEALKVLTTLRGGTPVTSYIDGLR